MNLLLLPAMSGSLDIIYSSIPALSIGGMIFYKIKKESKPGRHRWHIVEGSRGLGGVYEAC